LVPGGDNRVGRKGAVKKRTQRETKLLGKTSTKRNAEAAGSLNKGRRPPKLQRASETSAK
jgi:hypothetical protein